LERRKITIARLRSGINYKGPLDHILDSFYYLLKRFENKHIDDFKFGFYNYGYDKGNRRDPKDIPDSDIIIIPSENEFHYHIKDKNGKGTYIDPKNLEKSDTAIKEHFKDLKDKHIIILRSDRGDDENLYRNYTFKDNPIRKVSILDETDIPGNVHQLKYHFIKDRIPVSSERPYQFAYWGTDKRNDQNGNSGDIRHLILKELQVGMGRLNTRFIGKFSNVKRDMQPVKGMKELLPILNQSQYTLCFNWKDNTATTSRYHEALACGIIPMVYGLYDSTGILVKDDWQRVESAEELCEKIMSSDYESKFKQIHDSFKESLLTNDQIYDTFESKLLNLIEEKE